MDNAERNQAKRIERYRTEGKHRKTHLRLHCLPIRTASTVKYNGELEWQVCRYPIQNNQQPFRATMCFERSQDAVNVGILFAVLAYENSGLAVRK